MSPVLERDLTSAAAGLCAGLALAGAFLSQWLLIAGLALLLAVAAAVIIRRDVHQAGMLCWVGFDVVDDHDPGADYRSAGWKPRVVWRRQR